MRFHSKNNLNFLLHEVLNIGDLAKHSFFADHNREGYDMILEACANIGATKFRPILREMDSTPPEFKDGRIKVHPSMRQIIKDIGEGGWINAPLPYDEGGQQMPYMIFNACIYMFGAANYSATAFPFLTAGAANLIRSFGTPEQKAAYLPKMYSGEWQGTMALTEPEAGSSLGDLSTSATLTEAGHYLIKGQKVFISCGDHDANDNIVHLMLARIKGAPQSTKGISLFIVPRLRPDANGALQFNDVLTGGIFHKMGYKGAPIAHIITGENNDCYGYLLGNANEGLNCMFQMMNEARIAVGLNATSAASAAYYAALQYTRERKQGRRIGSKSPEQSRIIEHADVKRMLLFQRAVVEGSLGLLLECSRYADLSRVTEGEQHEYYESLLGLLTPVAKSYPAEMACHATSAAVQCLGGYGFTQEYLPEFFFREARIHPIHEGTTAIHGMDLLGRKIAKDQGNALRLLMEEINATIANANKHERLKTNAAALSKALDNLGNTTMRLSMLGMQGNFEEFLANATLYLEAFGINIIAWQWLKQGIAAVTGSSFSSEFYQGKLLTMDYFFDYELPKTKGLLATLQSTANVTIAMQDELFD